MSGLLKKLGIEKEKVFNKNFDYFYDFYKEKALSYGQKGELKFIRERGKVIIYVVLIQMSDDDYDSYKDGDYLL